jgi:hypothetical protein
MDKDRQIRFLYPPLIFLSSIAFGIWVDDSITLRNAISSFFSGANNTSVAVALLGASSLVLVIGFLLGTITVLLLRSLFPGNRFNYEFKLSDDSYKKIGSLILKSKNDTIRKKDRMYAGIVFDHSYIAENIHRWIIRRWNAFFIASSSTVALGLSLFLGHLLGISFTSTWVWTIIGLVILFILQGYSSWVETMRMIVFLTRVKSKDNSKNHDDTNDDSE